MRNVRRRSTRLLQMATGPGHLTGGILGSVRTHVNSSQPTGLLLALTQTSPKREGQAIGLLLGLTHVGTPRLAGGGGGGAALDADAVTLIAAMTSTPDATRQTLISDTIIALKAAGIWTELDRLWVMAAHTEQAGLLNWLNPAAGNLTAVNAPAFTQDRGFAGNGTTSYLNTNFVPSTDGVQYTLNDASLGVYSRTDAELAVVDMGARDGANTRRSFMQIRTTGGYTANVNQDVAGTASATATGLGLHVARRSASDATQKYRNGASIATGTDASAGLTARALFIGALNDVGVAGVFSTRQLSFAFVGASLSTQQQADLYTIVQAYMTAVGANV